MSEELRNINNIASDNTENIEPQNININEDVPIVTYVADAPKTSISFAEIINDREINNLTPEDSYNRIIEKEQAKTYHWNYTDEYTNNNRSKTYSKETHKNKKKHSNLGLKIFSAAMSLLFLISCISTISLFMGNIGNSSEPPVISNAKAVDDTVNSILENLDITIGGDKNAKVLTTQQIIEKAKPSVVGIEVITEIRSNFFGRDRVYERPSIGTGFIITEDGYIATNYHVVEDSKTVKVTLNSGEIYQAEVIGGDEAADIAVIKINAKNLPVAELGDSDALIQGDDVVAIGTPAGIEFAGTATKGIVSAINRDVEVPTGSGYSSRTKNMTVIQTDASINPGNSGGPLLNDKGQVIGINTMKLASSSFEGIGFAIPINIAIPVINDIIANPGIKLDTEAEIPIGYGVEDTSTVSFGLTGGTVIENGEQQGWKISGINEDGPCHNSGIQLSDIIIALDGTDVRTHEDLVELKHNYNPGDKVMLTIFRNGDTYDFEITLAAR